MGTCSQECVSGHDSTLDLRTAACGLLTSDFGLHICAQFASGGESHSKFEVKKLMGVMQNLLLSLPLWTRKQAALFLESSDTVTGQMQRLRAQTMISFLSANQREPLSGGVTDLVCV